MDNWDLTRGFSVWSVIVYEESPLELFTDLAGMCSRRKIGENIFFWTWQLCVFLLASRTQREIFESNALNDRFANERARCGYEFFSSSPCYYDSSSVLLHYARPRESRWWRRCSESWWSFRDLYDRLKKAFFFFVFSHLSHVILAGW